MSSLFSIEDNGQYLLDERIVLKADIGNFANVDHNGRLWAPAHSANLLCISSPLGVNHEIANDWHRITLGRQQ